MESSQGGRVGLPKVAGSIGGRVPGTLSKAMLVRSLDNTPLDWEVHTDRPSWAVMEDGASRSYNSWWECWNYGCGSIFREPKSAGAGGSMVLSFLLCSNASHLFMKRGI